MRDSLDTTSDLEGWKSNSKCTDIGCVLIGNAKHSLFLVSAGSILGSVLMIWLIDYLPRRKTLIYTYIILALLLVASGISFLLMTYWSGAHIIAMVFFVLTQIFFNFGPNTLIFILPAELFPTRYRATCHGISAAAGKLGSFVAQIVISYSRPGGQKMSDPDSAALGGFMIGFGVLMCCGAVSAWILLPEVQKLDDWQGLKLSKGRFKRLPNKTLEELARDGPTQYRSTNEIEMI
jgi:MFS transporter, PHS family, inorganic phosphate transporter